MFSVVPATSDDVEQLAELLGLLFAQEADFSPDRMRQERGLRLILEQPNSGGIFCVREGRRVLGMVNVLFTISTAEGNRVAWLEDLVVHPEYRGKGIGRSLLLRAIRAAKGAGCSRITLLTDDSNARAMRLYQSEGFNRSRMIVFRKAL